MANGGSGDSQQVMCDRSLRRVPAPDDYVEFLEADTEQSVVDRFEEQVRLHADRPAVKVDDVVVTYDELNRAANRIACAILARLPAPCEPPLASEGKTLEDVSEPVPVMIGQGQDGIAAAFGVWKAGKVYVALDPTDSPVRLRQILNDLSAKGLVTVPKCAARARELAPAGCEVIVIQTMAGAVPDTNPGTPVLPGALAYVAYTSGSTGNPKGVMHTHRSLLHDTWSKSVLYRISKLDRLSLLSWCTGQALKNITLALLNGASLHLKDVATDGLGGFGDWLGSEQISVLIAASPVFRSFLDLLTGSERFPDLRVIRLASDRVFPDDVKRFQRHFAASCVLLNGLSSTETGGIAAFVINHATRIDGLSVPIGYPMAGVDVVLLEKEGDAVSSDTSGVIAVRSRHLASGYWRRPELTCRTFRAAQDGSGAGIYRSGDLARRRPDGALEHIERCDSQVKIRGQLVDMTEVEAALIAHENVRSAAVRAFEDLRGYKRLVGYVVPATHPAATVGELQAHLAERLAKHMIPAQFVMLDELPKLANWKINRRALPQPPRSRPHLTTCRVLPGSAVEDALAGIWREILGLDEVGIHDPFLEVGGDSLLACRVVARVIDVFGVVVSIRSFLESPTISQVAAIIEKHRAAAAPGLPPIPHKPGLKSCPLSFAQERLWFLSQLNPDDRAYNNPKAIRLRGPLDIEALRLALEGLVARHAVLRTTIHEADGQPVQTVVEPQPLRLPVIDLTDFPRGAREEEAMRVLRAETLRAFDLSRDPMLRAALVRIDCDDHVLLMITSHIVSDDWSRGILFREVAALYAAFSARLPSPLPALPVQYADYAAWQRNWLQGRALEEQLKYWKDRLKAAPVVWEFPTDHPRPARQSFRGARREVVIDAPLAQALRDVGRQEGATLFMTLLAAWEAFLSRYSGQTDIVVGSAVAGRNRTELEGLIGFFVNTLALRTDLSGNPTFRELLSRVRESTLEDFTHQDLPFEKLVEELRPERNLSNSPLFQVMLVLQNAPRTDPQLTGLAVERIEIDTGTAKFDLSLSLQDATDVLRGYLEYSTDLFEAATITRLLEHFQTLLRGIVADPQRPIGDLPLMTDAERQQVLVEWNDTATDYPRDKCVHELFEEQVERTPDAVAMIGQDQELTFHALNERANRLAHHLIGRKVGPESLVGVCVGRAPEMVVGILAILKAGGAYVPLDPEYPVARLAQMLADAAPAIVLTTPDVRDRVPEGMDVLEIDRLPDAGPTGNPVPADRIAPLTPRAPAYVIYTSGSTGTAKGVVIEHRSLVNHMAWMSSAYPVDRQDRVLVRASLCFDASVWEIWLPLLSGAALCIAPREATRDPKELWDFMQRNGITVAQFVPTLLAAVCDLEQPRPDRLRLVFSGGEALPRALGVKVIRDWQIPVVNLYGPTEATIQVTHYACRDNLPEIATIPIGAPIWNTMLYVLDERMAPVPLGVPGELYIGGDCLAWGYLNRPELTAEKFVPDPFTRDLEARLYRTGDRVRWQSDGNLEYLGRFDRQVKLRGFRVEPAEIEAALASIPGVAQATVLVREDQPGDQRLVAYVVPADRSAPPAVATLRNDLLQRLPDYMVPTVLVTLDAFPLTPSGKVDRRALPIPETDWLERRTAFVAPRTVMEEKLAGLWREVLRVERVGIHDSFFELGGHSLLAMQLVSRINREFAVEFPLRSVFEAPTIGGLGLALLEQRARGMGSACADNLLNELECASEESAERELHAEPRGMRYSHE